MSKERQRLARQMEAEAEESRMDEQYRRGYIEAFGLNPDTPLAEVRSRVEEAQGMADEGSYIPHSDFEPDFQFLW